MLLLGVGSCFEAFLLAPIASALRTRAVPFRFAVGGGDAERASILELLGEPTAGAVRDAHSLTTDIARVAIAGASPFARTLALAARARDLPVVHLDAGVRTVAGSDAERRAAEGHATELCVSSAVARTDLWREGCSLPIHVIGDPVALAVAKTDTFGTGTPFAWLALEHGHPRDDLRALATLGMPVRTAHAAGAGAAEHVDAGAEAQLTAAIAARVLIVDSVGHQRVALAAGVPCVVLADAPLWPPIVAAGLATRAETGSGGLAGALARALAAPRPPRAAAANLGERFAEVLAGCAPPPAVPLPTEGDGSGRTFGDDEIALVAQALRSGTLNSTRGTFVTAFEQRFAKWLGRKHAIACASGSAAVHCAIAALQLQAGDEVVTTPITDMGALTPILYEGALPVFADVDPHTLNVTAATIAAQLTPRTRAIVVTHLFGMPCDMPPILQLAAARGIPVIEDTAQAFGATLAGRKVGGFGAIGTFSLQQGKHITTGEGGIVATDDDALARRMFLYVNKAWGYGDAKPDHYFPALNYRLTELQGAVACAQLPKLDHVVVARRGVAEALRAALATVPGLRLPGDPTGGTHSYWKFAFQVDPTAVPGGARALGKRMQQAGVNCVPNYIQKPAFDCELFRDFARSPVTALPLAASARAGQAMPLFERSRYPGALAALEHVIVLPITERYLPQHVAHVATTIARAVEDLRRG